MEKLKLIFLLISISELGAVKILVSWSSSLKYLDSEKPSKINTATKPTNMAIAVDYHDKREEIYFSDGQGHINRVSYMAETNGTVVIAEVGLVDGLAVDWVNNNLYWTDHSSKIIEMSTLDGLNRRVLFGADDGLDKPRAAVVDPSEGLLFWSDWGRYGKVSSSGLDGQKKTTVINNVIWPNGLTLDLNRKKLYIVDAKLGTLSTCSYDGSNYKIIFKSSYWVEQAFGLTYFSNKLYWTSLKERALESLDIGTDQAYFVHKHTEFGEEFGRLLGVKAIDPSLQPDVLQANACNNKNCSHQCLPGPQGTASCMCPVRFTLGQDKKTCVEEGFLLVSWRSEIHRHDLHSHIEQRLLDTTRVAVAIDVHIKKNFVFWSVIDERRIYRAPMEQLNYKTEVAKVKKCHGLAVDWVHDVLYWTDEERRILEAASLDGSKRTTVIAEDLQKPRAIALDPQEGLMFWSDWGSKPKIESAYLDGSNRTAIVKTNIVWPNGITIDYVQKKLYWTDGMLKTISSCLYDGSERSVILNSQSDPLHPFGISLLKGFIYWTDWGNRSLMKSSIIGMIPETTVLKRSQTMDLRPYGVKVVHSSLQRDQYNPCMKMNCNSLCVTSPNKRKARCKGHEIPWQEEEASIHRNIVSKMTEPPVATLILSSVKNDSFQLSSPTGLNNVVITWKCLKREGCPEDERYSRGDWQTKIFQGNEILFTVKGLLPASKYEVKVLASANIQDFQITTKNTEPSELPIVKTVNVNGSTVTVTWNPVDTCVPNFESYKYNIYKEGEPNELVVKGSTNLTETSLSNLQPLTSYIMHLYTDKPSHFVPVTFKTHEGDECQTDDLVCDGKRDCSDGRDEDISICAGIESLIVHKKNQSVVYFRCTVTKKTAEHLVKFSGDYSIDGSYIQDQFEAPAVPCTLWPDSYCFNISGLQGNRMYTFNVSTVIVDDTVGNPVTISTLTKEGIPGPPEDLHVTSYSPTSVDIEWRHPNESNGVLRNFVVNINEVETFEEKNCCQLFNLNDATAKEGELNYSSTHRGLRPASTYAISVTSKTLYLGGSKDIDVHTSPPHMDILKMPDLDVSSLTDISWEPRSDTPDKNSSIYNSLIKSYLLLIIPPKEPQQISTIQGDATVDQHLKSLLEKVLTGEPCSVLWNKQSDDAHAFKEPIKIEGLTARKHYELVWVQVSQYKDAYGFDHIISKPFEPAEYIEYEIS